jgi:hypothetical protein
MSDNGKRQSHLHARDCSSVEVMSLRPASSLRNAAWLLLLPLAGIQRLKVVQCEAKKNSPHSFADNNTTNLLMIMHAQ